MIDISNQLQAIHREVGTRTIENDEEVGVLLRRSYRASIEDVWDAVTDPDRVRRWFLPVSGDLRVGGSFQVEGNANGEILRCEPPRLLRVTWGAPDSLVELRLSADGADDTVLELAHTVPIALAGSTAGALYVGPGWDGALLGLDRYLLGEVSDDPVTAANSPEVQEFSRQSVHAWVAAVESSGSASPDQITAATEMSLAQFAPDLSQED